MARDFLLPDLGEGITEAQIVRVMVKEGQAIEEDQSLFEVETDKAAVEIPSPFSGKAEKIHVSEGQTVHVGDVMISFEGEGDGNGADRSGASAGAGASKAAGGTAVAEAKPAGKPQGGEGSGATATSAGQAGGAQPAGSRGRTTTAPAAPAVRKLARELGVDIDAIAGSGPGGRVLRSDVEAAAGRGGVGGGAGGQAGQAVQPAGAPVEARPAPAVPVEIPGVPGSDPWGAVRRDPLTQIRKTIAKQMIRSVSTIPHVTHHDRADVSEMERWRRQLKEATDGRRRVTAMAFVIKAVCTALKNHPVFNASLDLEAGETIYKEYMNIGVAVDTPRGLVVPNIRNADTMSVSEIGAALAQIAENARQSRFAIEDLRGGTFTITNVGALGGTYSTPIINYPEVAILGLGRSTPTPVVQDGQVVVRTIMPVSLSFDHRITDGAQAARFCSEIIGYLEHPATLVL